MRSPFVISALLLCTLAGACLWDYDTLSMEAKKMPEVVDAIVGRFDRNPPLYYEMRLERVAKELETSPERLDLYDDAAVACDKLGNDDDGLVWLARKRDMLQRIDPDGKRSDDWYRYYANVGTLRVHRWAKDGMRKEEVSELEQAIVEIEAAIEINPDAHFGREWVQVGLMRVIKSYLTEGKEAAAMSRSSLMQGHKPSELATGLVGLITLGAAWESPDIYHLLAGGTVLFRERNVEALARLRRQELIVEGRASTAGDDAEKVFGTLGSGGSFGQSASEIEAAYKALRANADEYHRNRTEFMMARLKAGRHPDTDPDFWDGYVETERISLRQFEPFIPRKWYSSPTAMLVISVAVISSPFVALYVVLRRRARFRARQKESSTLPPVA